MNSRPHVLLLGGHSRVGQLLTPLLLNRSWAVTSLIRTKHEIPDIAKLSEHHRGKLDILVADLEDVKDQASAQSILNKVNPDYVVFSAGAGGKGPQERTLHIDRDAATYFIRAAAETPSVTRFLLISWLACRHKRPSWWDEEQWKYAEEAYKSLGVYSDAKLASDDELRAAAAKRPEGFAAVDLRPGWLTNEKPGKVELGKTKRADGYISRASVAEVADALLAAEGLKSQWLDLVDGDEPVKAAVEKVVKDGVDAYSDN
ncbi:hypothetical protein VTK73DRAFT_9447 [Phialemonium thermophilum]|uniref:NAD(P)-binding domain-containing protein n=1 Tax=Phialemonium thermophilum TaxID=223376 RepID=A0ABR3XK77_9PEZI